MDSFTIVKKVKRLNRKGKLINTTNEVVDEKKVIVSALMAKCGKTEEEVLKAYDDFHLKHESGQITWEEYTHSKKVVS